MIYSQLGLKILRTHQESPINIICHATIMPARRSITSNELLPVNSELVSLYCSTDIG